MRFYLYLMLASLFSSLNVSAQSRSTVLYDTSNNKLAAPLPFFFTNILSGANITITTNGDGTITIAATGGVVGNFQTGSFDITNFFRLGITNILAGPGIAIGTNNGVLWITNTSLGGGSGITTNTTQFGPSVEFTIKTGVMLTNVNGFGLMTNDSGMWLGGDLNISGNILGFVGPPMTIGFGDGTILNYGALDIWPSDARGTLGSNTAFAKIYSAGFIGNGSGVTNLGTANNTAFQPAHVILTNLEGTVANNVTNVVSLSTSNAISKPLTNSYLNGVVKFYGLEEGANISITPNGSNYVIATSGGVGEANVNGEVSLTNASMIGWIYDKVGITNRLRSSSVNYGMTIDNQGTNVEYAVDGSTIPDRSELNSYTTGCSNLSYAIGVACSNLSYAIGLAATNNTISATNSASVTNWINFRQVASAELSNIVGLASTLFTNVPAGGTNIALRTAGGTNFHDAIIPPESAIHTFTSSVAATNDTANTNITIDMRVKTARLSLTNNATFTNFIGNAATTSGSFAVIIEPQLVNRTIVWPAFSTPTLGLYFRTNAGCTMWITLSNGVEYWLTGDRTDTNIVLTLSAFQ